MEIILQPISEQLEKEGPELTALRAVIFDFIGTLASVECYDMEASKLKLYGAIFDAGFKVGEKDFLKAYDEAHEKYRIVRYEELVEVTNAVWVSEALNRLGFKIGPEDMRMKAAINVFFADYLESLRLNPCVKELLARTSSVCKAGLISNFTFAPVIYAAVRKLGLGRYLNAVLVSEDVGWRKPNRRIFEEALKRLRVDAEETVYVGDSPLEDVKGATLVGMKTVFVPSQFYSLVNLQESGQKPDLILKNVCELHRKLKGANKSPTQELLFNH